jgi:formamidopyrimidine-DNA glycosylase
MPELPDVTVYVEHLERRLAGATLARARVASPNLLRTAVPPLASAEGRVVGGARRMGKRVVLSLEGALHLVFHLMISGRFHWRAPGGRPAAVTARRRSLLASFEFSNGVLELTEAATRKRASLHVVAGEAALRALDPGGLEVLDSTLEEFGAALRRENHTLKRALTDARLVSGIGNAYSDEILHRARLSPLQQTSRLGGDELARLHDAARATLRDWTDRLRAVAGDAFPEKVTAFRDGMAVHGRYRQPCPDCGAPVQRIVYADNETNYCARCQTGGRLLADRSLSRLLKSDWPKRLEELEG